MQCSGADAERSTGLLGAQEQSQLSVAYFIDDLLGNGRNEPHTVLECRLSCMGSLYQEYGWFAVRDT